MWQRALLSGVGLVALAGFFANPQREFLVLVGLLLLIWIRDLPVPFGLQRLAGILAGSPNHKRRFA